MTRVDTAHWEVVAIRFGTRTASKAKVYLNHQIYGEPDGPIQMDYFFWLARKNNRTILIDTGFNPQSGGKRSREMLIEPSEALARLGVDTDSIDTTIITHLHYDHAGNLDLAPASKILLARAEYEFWHSAVAKRRLFASAVEDDDITQLDRAHAAGRLELTEGDVDVEPGIRVVELGGHTPGQLAVVVNTAEGEVVLASDAIHYYEEFELDRPFVELDDLSDVFFAFDRIREMTTQGAILIPGHDPAVMTRYPSLSSAEPDLAVVIGTGK